MIEANSNKTMREALENASRVLAKWRRVLPFDAWNEYGEAIDRCHAALREPQRNCDVGTPNEQEERFKAFCASHWDINNTEGECARCPQNENVETECEFAWAQMPYEEGAPR